jgi:hypothetical protein
VVAAYIMDIFNPKTSTTYTNMVYFMGIAESYMQKWYLGQFRANTSFDSVVVFYLLLEQ